MKKQGNKTGDGNDAPSSPNRDNHWITDEMIRDAWRHQQQQPRPTWDNSYEEGSDESKN